MRSKAKRLALILIVGTALIAGVLSFRYFYSSRPVGVGPAGPEIICDAFTHPWTTRPVLLVGLGDSVTEGYGARRGYGYFDRLAANPADEFADMDGICLKKVLPNLRTLNLAVSGSTSLEHLQSQLPNLPIANPATLGIVVITTGGNDLIHNYGRTPPREEAMYGATYAQAAPWIEDFRQRLDLMVTQIEADFPGGCQIFIANIYDPTDESGDIERAGLPAWNDGLKILAAFNEAIQRCVQEHSNTHLVDFHAAFLGHGIHCTQFWAK